MGEVSAVYRRRRPERTVLYRVVQEQLNTFLAEAEARSPDGRGLPKYVRGAFRRYLDCGLLQKGFARFRCPGCGHESAVAFSCKERGLCPSCAGRRMADVSAHLVDRVLPKAPVRQWVLSVPRPVRYLLARDPTLLSGVLRIFLSEVFRDLRRRSGVKPAGRALCGGVTAVQRFGGALNLNVHFHTLLLDGVFVKDPEGGRPRFHPLPPPSPHEIHRILLRTRRRIRALLADRGYEVYAESGVPDAVQEEPGLFDVVQAAAIREWTTFSGPSGPVELLGRRDRRRDEVIVENPFSAEGEGYSLHAGVRIPKGDRAGLGKLCRYLLRPPFASERLERLSDGRILYRFRRPRPDGSSHVLLDPLDFMARLAALVPPPRFHLLRYHGVLGPHHGLRSRVVPRAARRRKRCEEDAEELDPQVRRKRSDWATLLRRSMGLDALACPSCGGRLEFEGCVEEPDGIRAWLRAAGEAEEAPPLSPARPPPQTRFEFDQSG